MRRCDVLIMECPNILIDSRARSFLALPPYPFLSFPFCFLSFPFVIRFTKSTMFPAQLPISPLLYFPIQLSLIASLIAFTPPTSYLRPFLLPIPVICNYLLLSTYSSYIPRAPWIGFVAGWTIFQLVDYVEKLLLSQWSYECYGPSSQTVKTKKADKCRDSSSISWPSGRSKAKGTIWDRLKFGIWAAVSNRYIASPYQTRNVPPYSYSDPSFVPTRSNFLLKNAAVVVICCCIIDLLAQIVQSPEKNQVVYAENRVPFFTRLNDVTMEEVATRTITSVVYWAVSYIVVQGFNTGLALFSVASGFDRPELWRPIFGPVSQIYTLRGFWG